MSLLYRAGNHVADTCLYTEEPRKLDDRGNGNALKIFKLIREQFSEVLRSRVESRLAAAGFLHASRMGEIQAQPVIINVLVERWRPETNTFHLPGGEHTITLEDVHMLSGLPVSGKAVSGSSYLDKEQLIREYLVAIPPRERDTKGRTVKMSWLKDALIANQPSETSSDDDINRWTRSLLLLFIGGVLMPDKTENKVHLQYLTLLLDFGEAGQYAWGAAVLAFIYRSLCYSSEPGILQLAGCSNIIYAWFWLRFPSLAPTPANNPPNVERFPLIARFGRVKLRFAKMRRDMKWFRVEVEKRARREFVWTPYRDPEIMAGIPAEAWREAKLGRSDVPLIGFHMVEWQFPRRVMRQFGFRQPIIRAPPRNLEEYRRISLQGRYDTDWRIHFAEVIREWDEGKHRRVKGDVIVADMFYGVSTEYRRWFARAGKPKLFPNEDYPSYWRPSRGEIGLHVKAFEDRQNVEESWLHSPIVEYSERLHPIQFAVDAESADDDDRATTAAAGLM